MEKAEVAYTNNLLGHVPGWSKAKTLCSPNPEHGMMYKLVEKR